ncbi:MAG: hypothetical protein ACREUF_01785 [Solimonas sp.]
MREDIATEQCRARDDFVAATVAAGPQMTQVTSGSANDQQTDLANGLAFGCWAAKKPFVFVVGICANVAFSGLAAPVD